VNASVNNDDRYNGQRKSVNFDVNNRVFKVNRYANKPRHPFNQISNKLLRAHFSDSDDDDDEDFYNNNSKKSSNVGDSPRNRSEKSISDAYLPKIINIRELIDEWD
jgi:hypothetical protein